MVDANLIIFKNKNAIVQSRIANHKTPFGNNSLDYIPTTQH